MNLFRTCGRLASESSERPERDREIDAIIIATSGILLAVAFWMHLRDHGEDPQASSRGAPEKVVSDEPETMVTKAVISSHLTSP